MSIVFLGLPGREQRAFVNALNYATSGAVELAIIRHREPRTLADHLKRAWEVASAPGLLQELWYAVALRLSKKTRLALKYFRGSSLKDGPPEFDPPRLDVTDMNGAEVHEILKKIAPKLIVVWCSAILKPHILECAPYVINFHTGILPYYRGAVANQFAVLRRDEKHIGSTIHLVTPGVDRGDIIAQIYGDTNKPPREMFREVNDKSLALFIEIAQKILAGENVPRQQQDQTKGEFFRLSQWSNKLRWIVGQQLLRWEEKGIF
ncbi:hypothetical protein A2763_02330 [Candidatus Kaiserbacteria bacterium RIFCSPHIGHO2_01_FULL_54_36]|uniref:Formyl transferase N-terminal domain-containing protein n=1 Tax=Candidatus Kaiserbacteria bacterium RIFCSPHIGHO2_01_FULL_54_36 TaxID=1798482 RepID=A0A1F6CNM9_9BACT|nr:MAG: hypothetical protein A2763_02330 [Candidatus Kaiserbacteria bacterium RIFCSPHIGHO2_01_FULL_54_36]OGG75996.1 MAG: hypothetical protein A3A41_03435 [Candidatus Kaiserbacteria bacterium RIFCSPLOWO2_01_FULL_54_22]